LDVEVDRAYKAWLKRRGFEDTGVTRAFVT